MIWHSLCLHCSEILFEKSPTNQFMFSICFEIFFNNSGQDLISTALFTVFYCSPVTCTWLRNPSGKFSFYSFYNTLFPPIFHLQYFFFPMEARIKFEHENGCYTSEVDNFISTASFISLRFVTQHNISILYVCSLKYLQYSVCWSSNKTLLFAFQPQNAAKCIHANIWVTWFTNSSVHKWIFIWRN